MNITPIAFAFDNNLVFPAKICISSLLMSAKEETFYDIFILHSENVVIDPIDFIAIQKYYGNCKITFRAVAKTLFKGCYEVRGITIATYYRLMIPELIPEYDKIIYSDVDVIFREDQSRYYEMATLENCYIAGVDSCDYDFDKEIVSVEYDKYLTNGYVYAGNMIFNSKLIREKGITKEFLKHVGEKHLYQDMDVINIVCKGAIQRLPLSFCLTPRLEKMAIKNKLTPIFTKEEVDKAFKKGTIHYAGPKPWKTMCCLNADVWWSVYRQSIFSDPKIIYEFGAKHFDFLDRLSLSKRLKNIWRFFVVGRKK